MKLVSPAIAFAFASLLLHAAASLPAQAASTAEAISQLKQMDSSDDPAAAAAAWKTLAESQPAEMTAVLAAIEGSKPLAANWLRSAADAIAESSLKSGNALPTMELEQFVLNKKHDPLARRQAYEWLQKVEPAVAANLIPGLLNDPSVEFRRDAVAIRILKGEELQADEKIDAAIAMYREALGGARDEDQVRQLAKNLRELDQQIDLPKHFGFIQNWHLIAPFDNTGRGGFDVAYPPESEINLEATYPGKGEPASWKVYKGEDDFGVIDLNKPFGAVKEVVGYALTELNMDKAREVELRLGCKNAWKIWLNGELLFARDEYHRGMQMDQYRLKAKLNAGPNRLLIKLCQNEQTESWTKEWEFQIRMCDATGTAINP